MKKIGFIGLGIMGNPMARNLLKGGVQLLVNDVSAKAVERLREAGAQPADREEIGTACEIVFLILPNGSICRDVIGGEDGLVRYMRPGSLVVDCSSVTPEDSRFCADLLGKGGVAFLDAPVSGGEEGAVRGSLAIMAGGAEADFARAKPYFDILGSKATLVGPIGSGSIAKLANQMIVNLNIATLSEALVFAKKAGADPEKVVDAIRSGLAGSQVLEDKAPRMLRGDFAPGGKILINRKDIGNVLSTAHALDIPVPMSAALFEILQALRISGSLEEDHSAIIRYFERLAGIESL